MQPTEPRRSAWFVRPGASGRRQRRRSSRLQGVGSFGGVRRGVKGGQSRAGAESNLRARADSKRWNAPRLTGTRCPSRGARERGPSACACSREGVPSFRRCAFCDTGRTRGFEEGTRASARAFARALEACVFRSASRRRRGACLLVALAREIASRTPASPSPGRPAKAKSAARSTTKPTLSRRGTGERTRAGFDSSRTCAHASFVLQKSVGRCLAQRSAHRRVRGARPLACVPDPREREPSESRRARVKTRGARGERRAAERSERGASSSRERHATDEG